MSAPSVGEVMSAPLQNRSLNGSIDISEHPLGTGSSEEPLKTMKGHQSDQ